LHDGRGPARLTAKFPRSAPAAFVAIARSAVGKPLEAINGYPESSQPTTVPGPAAALDRLSGRHVECFGMSAAVVLGEHLTDLAWPVRNSAVADLAASDRKLGDRHREAAGL